MVRQQRGEGGSTLDAKRARDLFDEGLSCRAIARELNVSPSTVSAWAKREELSFDGSKTHTATEAARATRAERRGRIIDRLYDRVERILDRLEADTYTYRLVSGDGVHTFHDEHPPAQDERSLSNAISAYLVAAAKLELADDTDGLAPVESMLGRLAQRFGLVETP